MLSKKFKKLFKLVAFAPLSMMGICSSVGDEDAPVITGADGSSDGTDVDNADEGDVNSPEKTFTQSEVNRMMKGEKEKGRAAILKELGVKDFRTAKEGLDKYRASVEESKTDLQKATDAVAQANTEKAEAESRAVFAETCVTAIQAGVSSEYVKDFVAIALQKASAEEEADMDDIISSMKTNPAYSGFFTSTQPASNGATGTGKAPASRKSTPAPQENYGAKLAKSLKGREKSQNPYFTN